MITDLCPADALELDIETCRRLLVTGQTKDIRATACKLMTLLIAERPQETIERMERERGLA